MDDEDPRTPLLGAADERADRTEVGELLDGSDRLAAPRRGVAALDEQRGSSP